MNLCAGVTCPAPQKCDPATGKCVTPPPPDGGTVFQPPPPEPDGGPGGLKDDNIGDGVLDDTGCACTTAGLAKMSAGAFGGTIALALLLVMRRRRRDGRD